MVKLIAFDRAPRMNKNPCTRARNKSIEYSIYLTCVSFCTISLSPCLNARSQRSPCLYEMAETRDETRIAFAIYRCVLDCRCAAQRERIIAAFRVELKLMFSVWPGVRCILRSENRTSRCSHTHTDQRCVPTHTTK